MQLKFGKRNPLQTASSPPENLQTSNLLTRISPIFSLFSPIELNRNKANPNRLDQSSIAIKIATHRHVQLIAAAMSNRIAIRIRYNLRLCPERLPNVTRGLNG
jgi:hypothetical protein